MKLSKLRQIIREEIQKLNETKLRQIIREEIQKLNETRFYVFYNRKKIEIIANSLWDAKEKAIQQLKVPKSEQGLVAVLSKSSYDDQQFRFESSIGQKKYNLI